MAQLVVPSVGESIQEVQISNWLKKEGDWVQAGEEVVELETEKATVQVPSPVAGVLTKILKSKEQFATVGEAIAEIDPSAKPASVATPAPAAPSAATSTPAAKPAATGHVMPAAQKMMEEKGLRPDQVVGSGPGGRVLKEDVQRAVPAAPVASTPAQGTLVASAPSSKQTLESPAALPVAASGQRSEEVKPMSMIRRTIAQRLVQAQHQAALLTTFNEVDMQPVMQLRNKYRDAFQEKHGVKLGFMSFFAKAACEALRRFPAVNAEIRGNNIVYRNYADIGIAIGGGKGLVVPVLRNVELMSFASIERTIGEFAKKAMENRLMPEDLEGGTFTISNGGIYGSLLSTPIVNPPQSAILGLHSIQDRPVAVQGEVVVRPMMYLALTYDHRIIDGREAVTFLRTIKEVIEDPTRLFLEV
ncbi:MAG: 2-oxoglutarate dehydrogenase complex dihydrolipoyllysine-residue succinyltransferase [Pirellulaceae bacterium]